MAEEEVKTHIRTEADNRGAIDAKAKIIELREEAARLRASAEVYSSKHGFDDGRARTARTEAAAREREASRLERPINAEQKTAQKSDRDEKAQALREHRAAERTAARDAAEEKKKVAVEDRAAQTAEKAAGKAGAREQAEEKKKFAAEERAEKKAAVAEERAERSFGRRLFGGASGGLVGAGVGFGIDQAFTEYTERQGIALRAAAQRKMDERGLAIAGSWRGSSSQTLAQVHALDDDIARQEANRPELVRKANSGIFDSALRYGAAGAGTGFALSGGNPIGAGIGFVAGAATGAWKSFTEGSREKDEDRATLEAKRKKREELEALGKKQVREEDGQIEIDLAQHRSERTMSGQRAAFVDEQKKKFLNRYRELQNMNLSEDEAAKTAGLETETAMRDRQIAAGSSLVNARSGAGDIAAAAAWGGMATPGMAETRAAIDALHATVKNNSAAMELRNHKDQSVPRHFQ